LLLKYCKSEKEVMLRGFWKLSHIIFGFVKLKSIYKKEKIKLSPKRVYTRSHPDPEPAMATNNPKQLLRKKTIVEG
jgi:hypothetical protein